MLDVDLELALAAVGLRAIGVTDRMQAGLWAGGTGSEPSQADVSKSGSTETAIRRRPA